MGKKRIAVFLAFVMALSVVLGQLTPYITTKAAGSTLIIHYGGREDGNYDGWNLWVWEEGKDGKQVDFKAEDDFGKIAVTSISKPGKVGFIVRLNEWEAKDIETDRFVEVGDGVTEIWLTSGKEKIAETARKMGVASVVLMDTFEAAMEFCVSHAEPGDAVLMSPACASWGMFKNYEERGTMFKDYVKGIAE